MPQEPLINDFSAGWCPSDHIVNGRKNCLLKMDNVELDENGALTLTGGVQQLLGPFDLGAPAHTLYSKYLVTGSSYVKKRYSAHTDGRVFRDGVALTASGAVNNAAFAAGYNRVFIASDQVRLKDDGTQIWNLGITKPTNKVTTQVQAPSTIDIKKTAANYAVVGSEGSVTAVGSAVQLTTDAATFLVKALNSNATDYPPLDATTYASSGQGLDQDIFKMDVKCSEPSNVIRIRIEVLLEIPDADGLAANYYYFEWLNESTKFTGDRRLGGVIPEPLVNSRVFVNPFNFGADAWSSLECLRKDFNRAGNDSSLTWKDVRGVRISVEAGAVTDVFVSTTIFYGGTNSPLKGLYEYIQINVSTIHGYVGKSGASPISDAIWTDMSHVTVTPQQPTDTQVDQVWIFRRGGTLEQFYLIKVLTVGSQTVVIPPRSRSGQTATVLTGIVAFNDDFSDRDALALNITANLFLTSVAYPDLPDQIFTIVGPMFGRMLYFTRAGVYFSDENNPDSYDSRNILRYSGASTGVGVELFLWAHKVTENTILVGTSQDVYTLTGTFVELPDGFLDVYLRPLGTPHVPISFDSTQYNGNVCYMANDGWRMISPGGESLNLTKPNTDALYDKQTRYGYAPALILPSGAVRFSCTVSHDKLYCVVPHTSNSRRVEVYDFIRKYWRNNFLDPNLVYAEEDGKLIAYYADTGYLGTLDDQDTKLLDQEVNEATQQTITILTPVLDSGSPRHRKDPYTLKFRINTGGSNVTLYVYRDEGYPAALGTFTLNTTSLTEVFLDISSFVFLQSYQFEFTGLVNDFALADISIVHDTFPLRTSHLIVRTDYGTSARKRLETVPFVLDPRGFDVSLTPFVDGIPQTAATYNYDGRKPWDYLFTVEKIGKYFDYVFASPSGLFEFYEFLTPRNIQVFPEQASYLKTSSTNYGTSARKRLPTVPFKINCLGNTITCTPIIDGARQTAQTFTSGDLVETFNYQYSADSIGVDFEYEFTGTLFEFWELLQPRSIEVFPEPNRYRVVPNSNFGSANKKRYRTWPFVLDPRDGTVTFTPSVDGVVQSNVTAITGAGKLTRFHFFIDDVFGVDYGGVFSSDADFELWEMMNPELVQILPIAKRFDQIGPAHLFRYGKLKCFEIRVLPYGTAIPYVVYFQDTSEYSGSITTVSGAEATYRVELPKTTSGAVLRIEFGPTAFNFHRYYIRLQFARSGGDTDVEWLTVASDK